MNVIGYINNRDIVLQDGTQMAVIANSHYVLAIGDRVCFKHEVEQHPSTSDIEIEFQSNQYCSKYDDQVIVKFQGSESEYQRFLTLHTVH